MYEVIKTKRAIKYLKKLDASNKRKIEESLSILETDPKNKSGQHDISKLKGRDGYRLRIGSFRVLYLIQDEEIIVLVLDIGPRGDIYK